MINIYKHNKQFLLKRNIIILDFYEYNMSFYGAKQKWMYNNYKIIVLQKILPPYVFCVQVYFKIEKLEDEKMFLQKKLVAEKENRFGTSSFYVLNHRDIFYSIFRI